MPAPATPADPRDRPIGVFDSGVGGLTVLHELLVRLPGEDFVYLADTARFPYGGRTPEELERFSLQIAEELVRRRVKLLVVACNSAASAALPALTQRMLQTTLGVDVIGVVRPGAIHAVAATHNGKVGLLATPATVASGAYREGLAAADPYVQLTEVACPDLAQQIERGTYDDDVLASVRAACAPLREAGVDTVILGCTHYPLLRPMLQRTLGPGVSIVSSGEPLARSVEHVLGARGLAAIRPGEGDYRFLTTADPAPFAAAGSRFLQLPLTSVDQVTLSPTMETAA